MHIAEYSLGSLYIGYIEVLAFIKKKKKKVIFNTFSTFSVLHDKEWLLYLISLV